jgi:flavodoxin
MTKTLVVFYSRSGSTRAVGRALAEALGADVEEIRDTKQRAGVVGYLRSALDATFRRLTRLEPIALDPAAYDLVVVGTPIWNASVSSPVRSFLVEHGMGCKAVALFCTFGGSGSVRAFRQMAELCGKAPLGTLAIRDQEVDGPVQRARIATFVEQLGVATARR